MRYTCDTPSPDGPLPVPEAVLNDLPLWQECTPDNCGDHRHDLYSLGAGNPHDPDRISFLQHEWTCHLCGDVVSALFMHPLPCGHALCRSCLEEAVLVRVRGAAILQGGAAIAAAAQSNKWQDYAAALRRGGDLGAAQRAQETADAAQLWAQALAGLTCCGQDAELEQWMKCMRPRTAKIFWTVLEALEARQWKKCGWRDCGEFISPLCGWLQSAWRESGNLRWHCIRCGGNSQLDQDYGERPSHLVPAR